MQSEKLRIPIWVAQAHRHWKCRLTARMDEEMDGTDDRQVEPAPCTQQLHHNVEQAAEVHAPGNTIKTSMSKRMASNIEPTLATAARPPSFCSTRRAPMQSEKLRIPTWMAQAHRHWKCMLTASMDEEMDGTDDRQVEPTHAPSNCATLWSRKLKCMQLATPPRPAV